MVQAVLNAFPPNFRANGRVSIDLREPPPRDRPALPPTDIHDARALQGGADPADFFDRHGFALLQHVTAITDWDRPPSEGYLEEIETLIRERLLPGRKLSISPYASLVRRGRGTATDAYGTGVHQDCGMSADDYQQLVGAFASPEAAAYWRQSYDNDAVESYMMIDFWRTTGMSGPLRHMPLAVCDPNSVDPGDIIPTEIHGITANGRAPYQMVLRHNPAQDWYYYPRMSGDEVLAFKLLDLRKSDTTPRLRSCFHSAFDHPETPEDAERRQSCEFRVGVYILR